MNARMIVILDPLESPGRIHIAGATHQHETICGWVDVEHEEAPDDAVANCPSCLNVIDYCNSAPVRRARKAAR